MVEPMTEMQFVAHIKQKRFRATIAFKAAQLKAPGRIGDRERAAGNVINWCAGGISARSLPRHASYQTAARDAGSSEELGWLVEICGRSPVLSAPSGQACIPIAFIIDKVATAFGVRVEDIVSARRSREVVLPRQVAMYLARTLTPRSLPQIGSKFGDRDHSTVIHAIRKVEKQLAEDPSFADQVERLAAAIAESDRWTPSF